MLVKKRAPSTAIVERSAFVNYRRPASDSNGDVCGLFGRIEGKVCGGFAFFADFKAQLAAIGARRKVIRTFRGLGFPFDRIVRRLGIAPREEDGVGTGDDALLYSSERGARNIRRSCRSIPSRRGRLDLPLRRIGKRRGYSPQALRRRQSYPKRGLYEGRIRTRRALIGRRRSKPSRTLQFSFLLSPTFSLTICLTDSNAFLRRRRRTCTPTRRYHKEENRNRPNPFRR